MSLDALTGLVLDRPWMRAAAVATIPVAIGVQLYRRHQALAAEETPESAVTPLEEGSTAPPEPPSPSHAVDPPYTGTSRRSSTRTHCVQ
jgi:hypothetical protein